jgi:hypothetical protein
VIGKFAGINYQQANNTKEKEYQCNSENGHEIGRLAPFN